MNFRTNHGEAHKKEQKRSKQVPKDFDLKLKDHSPTAPNPLKTVEV